MNLARLDMNLLLSLDALLRNGNVTRAAEQLGLTQPALSASLARLRKHFGDELLVRTGNTYRLTPLATLLLERTQIALVSLDRVFDAQPEFDPSTSQREFSMLVTDYALAVLGNTVAAILAEEAPRARLRMDTSTAAQIGQAEHVLLTTDLLLRPHGDLIRLPHQDLHTDEWVCVVSADNPVVERGLTLDDLQTMPWVAPFQTAVSTTPAARQMRILGVEPRIQVTTESFMAVPGLIAGTDRIALLQRRLMSASPPVTGVRIMPCPFEVSPMVQAMWWHPTYTLNPEHIYIRDVVARAAQEAAGTPHGADDV